MKLYDSVDQFVDVKTAAKIVGKSPTTLNNNRRDKCGFPYYKQGRSVRYRVSELLAIMESGRVSFDKEAE